MKKRVLILLGIMIFSIFLMGCGKKAEEKNTTTLESEHFTLVADTKESTTGNYKINLEFTKDSPACSYVLYENDKEVTKAVKEKAGIQKFPFEMKNKKSGKYKYKIKVVDELGTEIEKNIEVKVNKQEEEKPKDDEVKNNENTNVSVETPSEPDYQPDYNETPSEGDNDIVEPEVPEVPTVPYWSPYQYKYQRGDVVMYNGNTYTCIQAHTSLPDWYPTVAASLWAEN